MNGVSCRLRCSPLGLRGLVEVAGSLGCSPQAVRPAGRRLRESDEAKVFVPESECVADVRALGIEVEMFFACFDGIALADNGECTDNHPYTRDGWQKTLERKARRRGGRGLRFPTLVR